GPRHLVDVEQPSHMPAASPLERGPGRAVEIPISVPAPPGGVPGVEVVLHHRSRYDGHVIGQTRVERRHQAVRCYSPISLEVRDLAFGVRSSVGTSRGVDHHVLADDRPQRSLELLLDGAPALPRPRRHLPINGEDSPPVCRVRRHLPMSGEDSPSLLLPTREALPVVLQHDFDIHLSTDPNGSQSTSSMITTGAASPRRGPLWMIRVYPPGRSASRGIRFEKSRSTTS